MSEKRHNMLEKQLEMISSLLQRFSNKDKELFEQFVHKINEAYYAYEDDRELLENSMELSSKELLQANKELRYRNAEIQAINKITNLIHKPVTENTYTEIVQEISKTTQLPVAVLQLYDEIQNTLTVVGHIGQNERGKYKLPLTLEDLKSISNFNDIFIDEGFICVPLASASHTVGFLTLLNSDSKEISPRVIDWLKTAANQLAIEIDRKNMDTMIQQQKANMISASKMSELGKMAGGIAHEINTPLAIISMNASLVKDLIEEPELDVAALKEISAAIEQTAARIAKIVQGLRAFSREEKDHEPFNPVNISNVVQETLQLCGERFKNKGIKLEAKIDPHLSVSGHSTQLSQVLLNLINNSFDVITTLPEQWVRVEARDLGDTVELSVTDSGKGISKEIQEKLFRPFFTTKEIGKGTGLGLSISLGIIKKHSGELYLDKNSRNTRFVIVLPKTAQEIRKAS